MRKLGVFLAVVMLFATVAFAANQTIQALLADDVTIKLNGTALTLRDSDGGVVHPIVYNGTTYLPVRSISETLGLDVSWDGKTKTVSLIEKNSTQSEIRPDKINQALKPSKHSNLLNRTVKDNKNLRVGEIGKVGDIYVSLNYVKRMDYLPTKLIKEEVNPDNEVILGFFEFYNDSNEIKEIDPDGEITCYVDGVKVSGAKTNIKVGTDKVSQFYSEDIDPGCQMLSCQDFEVKKGWKEIKFYYNSDCIWSSKSEEITSNPYPWRAAFETSVLSKETKKNEVIFDGGYKVEFEGFELYSKKKAFNYGEDDFVTYAIFKYKVTNTTSKALNFSSAGRKMRAYQNGVFLGDADSIMLDQDKFEGFINYFKMDKLEPGTSANVYVAFEARDVKSDFYMVYDDGRYDSHYCGSVYIKHE